MTPEQHVLFSTELVQAYRDFLTANGEVQHTDEKQLILSIKERGGYQAARFRDAQGRQARGLRGVKIKDRDTWDL